MSSTGERVSYRRFLNSFARKLSSNNVNQLVFIYGLDIKSDEEGGALNVLLRLEHLAHFSFENPIGLVQIAKDVECLDWAKKFEEYVKSRSSLPPRPDASLAGRPSANGLKHKPLPSEVRQNLEHVHDKIVEKCLTLEKKFQEIWNQNEVTKEEGSKLLRRGERLVREMQKELEKGKEKLDNLPQRRDSLSSSESGSSIDLSSSPDTSSLIQSRGERSRDIPCPKPRRPKPPPPYKSTAQGFTLAVEESTRHITPMLQTRMSSGQEAHALPPPVPPKKQHSPRLPTKISNGQRPTSRMCYTPPPVCLLVQQQGQGQSEEEEEEKEQQQQKLREKEGLQVSVEESDQTGDSGIESGSGSVRHGTVAEWKGWIQNPPPENTKSDHGYTSLRNETKDEEQLYQVVEQK
jgi:hypothetical protein